MCTYVLTLCRHDKNIIFSPCGNGKKNRSQKFQLFHTHTHATGAIWVLVPVGEGGYKERNMVDYYALMYENGKMRPVETVPGMGDKGE
jgi:hypothetical protein